MIARLCTFVLAGCVWLNAQQPDPYSKQKEAALGASMTNHVRMQTSPILETAVTGYVERLGKRLGGGEWEFTVISDDRGGSTHEPRGLPGGYVVVPLPLILAVDNEAELAGMLAHSMAHVTDRHSMRVANVSTIPLIWVGGWVGAAGRDDRLLIPGFSETPA